MTEAEALPGQAVQDSSGRIGLITEPARKAGMHKGKCSVIWQGMPYTVLEWPEDLQPVELQAKS